MKLPLIMLLLAIAGWRCVNSKGSGNRSQISFSDTKWTLVKGKVNDSAINFSLTPGECFTVSFYKKKFRKFDGSFSINGTSVNKQSLYYTTIPYTGFYKIKDSGKITLTWFENIAWSMDFDKHAMGRTIQKLFDLHGRYEHSGNTLLFYKLNGDKKDTAIALRASE